jgi:hypothetical protein
VLAESRRAPFEQWLRGPTREAVIPGLIGDYPFEAIDSGKIANRAAADKPAKAFEDPQVVPGRVGNGLRLSGENNVTTAVGGDFTRHDPLSIALWIKRPAQNGRRSTSKSVFGWSRPMPFDWASALA